METPEVYTNRAELAQLRAGEKIVVRTRRYPPLKNAQQAVLYHRYDDTAHVKVRVQQLIPLIPIWLVLCPTP